MYYTTNTNTGLEILRPEPIKINDNTHNYDFIGGFLIM